MAIPHPLLWHFHFCGQAGSQIREWIRLNDTPNIQAFFSDRSVPPSVSHHAHANSWGGRCSYNDPLSWRHHWALLNDTWQPGGEIYVSHSHFTLKEHPWDSPLNAHSPFFLLWSPGLCWKPPNVIFALRVISEANSAISIPLQAVIFLFCSRSIFELARRWVFQRTDNLLFVLFQLCSCSAQTSAQMSLVSLIITIFSGI